MKRRNLATAALAAVAVVTLGAGVASAAWLMAGIGTGSASVGGLNAPTGLTAATVAPTSSAIDITFNTATNPAGTTYTVTRDKKKDGTAGPQIACSNVVSSCHDTGLTASTTYTYSASAVNNNWLKAAATTASATTAGPALTVQTVTLADSGQAGRINAGDTVALLFSEPIRPQSVCSTFTSSSSAQTLGSSGNSNGDFSLKLKDDAAAPATANDQLTLVVTDTCGATVNFGTLDLGSPNWTTTSGTYSATGINATTLAISGDHKTVTLKVGTGTSTPVSPTPAISSATSTFVPSTSIKDDATNTTGASGSQTTTTLF